MTVQISEPNTGQVNLIVTGISLGRLNTSREISNLVAELRDELESVAQPQFYSRLA